MQKRALRVIASLATLAVLAGCGGGAKPSTDPGPSQGGTPGAVAPKDSIVVTLPVDINTLDPAFIGQTQEWGILKHTSEGLIFRDAKGELKPWLAESWTTPDPLTWEFKLKEGVKFHDGTPFNAEAVAYNIERARNPEIKPRAQFAGAVTLDQVEVLDEYSIRLTTKAPAPTMLTELFNLALGSPTWFEQGSLSEVAIKPIGTGPYKFVEWVKDDHITLEANPDYYGAQPAIKKIIYRTIPEAHTRVAELETGNIDLATDLSPDQISTTLKGKATIETLALETGRRIHLAFRTDVKPFDDYRVRQAINYAINVEAIGQGLFGGGLTRMSSNVVPPNNDPSLQPYAYDVEKAKQLLADAGYPNGFETVLEHPINRYVKDTELVQVIAADLAKIGVKVKLVPMEWSAYNNKVSAQKNADAIYLVGLSSAFNVVTDLFQVHPNYALTGTHWNDPTYLAMYDEMTATPADQRQPKAFALERYVVEQAPWVFLYRQQHFYAYKKGLEWEPRPDDYVYLYTAKWSGN